VKVVSGRAQRRSRRAVEELTTDGRERVRSLVANASLAVLPTSDAVARVTARLAPGNVSVIVAARRGLGVDQTIAVSEMLASKGYPVTPEVDVGEIRPGRHFQETVYRLSRSGITRVLVVEPSGHGEPTEHLLAELHDQTGGLRRVGIKVATTGPGLDTEQQAAMLSAWAPRLSFVATETSAEPAGVLSWVREMRVRGLELPVEIGLPGVAFLAVLRREVPAVAASLGVRNADTYDPTRLVVELADDQALERLVISGLRLDTCNEVAGTEDWRQRIYDLVQPARSR